MSILLTDENNPYYMENGSHLLPGEDKYCYQAFNEGAKAQLKEAMRWLRAHCRGTHAGFGHYGVYDYEIEALLKEVEG